MFVDEEEDDNFDKPGFNGGNEESDVDDLLDVDLYARLNVEHTVIPRVN